MTNEKIGQEHVLGWPATVVAAVVVLAGVWLYVTNGSSVSTNSIQDEETSLPRAIKLEEKVLPAGGVTLPVRWNDLGAKMTSAGVIDQEKFEALYASRGGLNTEMKAMLNGENNGHIRITAENSGVILNFLWALGLGTKNEILETGPMVDRRYGGAGNFASTGGWTLGVGQAMDHYSQHPFIVLTTAQQQLVESVSQNIYRPCCDNSTYFPDCNHGLAMLGLLELMAAQGVSETEMYRVALQVNAYWFPDTYLTIAEYLKTQGRDWAATDPKELLGANYSSGNGYQKILAQVTPPTSLGGGGCGV